MTALRTPTPSFEELVEARRASGVPMFNDNKMKLGIFGSNCSHGLMATHAESTYELTWEHTQKIAQLADGLGFEAMLPVARYRGMGGETNFNGTNYETHTWAAGLAQATEQIMVFSTTHVPTKHPIVAAKESVTVDHISGGRFGLNMTMGWFKAEMEMFGGTQREHDERYRFGSVTTDYGARECQPHHARSRDSECTTRCGDADCSRTGAGWLCAESVAPENGGGCTVTGDSPWWSAPAAKS